MPSPFPGMNPYIERDVVWSDFHPLFIVTLKKALVPQVQPEFYVKIDEHVYVHLDDGQQLVGRPDVSIAKGSFSREDSATVSLLEAPVRVRMPEVAYKERSHFIEIFDREDHSLVTVIELLSPTDKRTGKDREQFVAKREQILESAVHYVEIDLLRGGPRLPLKKMPACDYYALISTAEDRPDMGFWPIMLREPLPTIPIPLPEPKTNVRLPLQELLHQAYDEAGYANYIYSGPPQPRLRGDDAQWAKKIVSAISISMPSKPA